MQDKADVRRLATLPNAFACPGRGRGIGAIAIEPGPTGGLQ